MTAASVNRRPVLVNAASSALCVVGVGLLLFLLYRYVISTLGVRSVGSWSVAVSIVSISNVAALCLPLSLARTVSKYQSRNDRRNVVAALSVTLGYVLAASAAAALAWSLPARRILLDVLAVDPQYSTGPGLWLLIAASWCGMVGVR